VSLGEHEMDSSTLKVELELALKALGTLLGVRGTCVKPLQVL
jgi:hypothetical protein